MTGCLTEAAKVRGRARIRGLTPPPETADDRILHRALSIPMVFDQPSRQPKPTAKWRRMADMYKRFAAGHQGADFGEEAALTMFLHESTGTPLPDPKSNGYALGKKWMDVTVAMWKEDILLGNLFAFELIDDYPDWFLERIGVLELGPLGGIPLEVQREVLAGIQ